jgi:hypothetical protein
VAGGFGQIDCEDCAGAVDGGAGQTDCEDGDCCCTAAGFEPGPTVMRVGAEPAGGWFQIASLLCAGAAATFGLGLGFDATFGLGCGGSALGLGVEHVRIENLGGIELPARSAARQHKQKAKRRSRAKERRIAAYRHSL